MKDAYNSRQIDLIFKQILLDANPQLSTLSVKNYLSDIRHFIGWHANSRSNEMTISGITDSDASVTSLFSYDRLSLYESSMRGTLTNESTLKRRMNSIKLVQRYLVDKNIIHSSIYKGPATNIEPSVASDMQPHTDGEKSTFVQNIENSRPIDSNAILKPYNSLKPKFINRAFFFGLPVLAFLASLFYFSLSTQSGDSRQYPYQQMIASARDQHSQIAARPILFAGVVRDSLGNPIVDAKKFQFKLYHTETGGQAVYESGLCELRPSLRGQIRAYIGGSSTSASSIATCGTQIPKSIAEGISPLYLGITVGADAEMSPRQQLANSALSTNALRIDGFGLGTDANSIPYIQSDGTIRLSNPNSTITSTSSDGKLTIGASSALLLSSGQFKDIEFEATQSGNIRFRTDTNAGDQMIIAQSGNVGINTTPNQFKLEISGSIGPSTKNAYNLGSVGRSWGTVYTNRICFTSESYCIDKDNMDGMAIETADIAETYPTEVNSEYGDVMAIGQREVVTSNGDKIRQLVKATSANNAHLLGVIANNKDRRVVVGNNVSTQDNPRAIALKGRIPVKINPSSAAIKPGDYLSTSSVAGQATKAKESGIMIGRALDTWTPGQGQQTVMTYIETSYAQIESDNLQNLAQQIKTLDLFPRSVQTSKIISPIIQTTTLTAQTIQAEEIATNQLTARSATISGTLTAETVDAKNIQDLAARIEEAVKQTQSLEKQAVSSQASGEKIFEIQSSLDKLIASDVQNSLVDIDEDPSLGPIAKDILSNNLTIMETASVFNLEIGGGIRSLTNDLHINALSTIQFMQGAVTLAANGDINTKGALRAEKGIATNTIQPLNTASDLDISLGKDRSIFVKQTSSDKVSARIGADGRASFDALSLSSSDSTPSAIIAAADNLLVNGLFTPAIETQSSSVGIAKIPSEEREVAIYTSQMIPGARIFLTSITANSPPLTLGKTEDCTDAPGLCKPYFTVTTSEAVTTDLEFNWLIIQTSP